MNRFKLSIAVGLGLMLAALLPAQGQEVRPVSKVSPVLEASAAANLPDIKTAKPEPSVEQVAWEVLSQGASDRKAGNRAIAISALSAMGGNAQALAMVESALSDSDETVRQEAATRLGEMGAPSSIPKLKAALQDKSPDVAFAAARALAGMGDTGGRDNLIEVLTGERKVTGGALASSMGWARQEMASPVSLLLMGASQSAGILVGPYAPIGIAAIRELTTDHSAPDRAVSAQALAFDNSERVIKVLENALQDRNWTVRASAADALGRTSEPGAIPQLVPLLKDKKIAVRYMAAASIVRLSSVSVGFLRW